MGEAGEQGADSPERAQGDGDGAAGSGDQHRGTAAGGERRKGGRGIAGRGTGAEASAEWGGSRDRTTAGPRGRGRVWRRAGQGEVAMSAVSARTRRWSEACAGAVSTFGARSASVHDDGGEEEGRRRPMASPALQGHKAARLGEASRGGRRGRRRRGGGGPARGPPAAESFRATRAESGMGGCVGIGRDPDLDRDEGKRDVGGRSVGVMGAGVRVRW
nr:spidroin-1-like [Aegilops tauschii subsp. strangulata]